MVVLKETTPQQGETHRATGQTQEDTTMRNIRIAVTTIRKRAGIVVETTLHFKSVCRKRREKKTSTACHAPYQHTQSTHPSQAMSNNAMVRVQPSTHVVNMIKEKPPTISTKNNVDSN